MRRLVLAVLAATLALLVIPPAAPAHFQGLYPSSPVVSQAARNSDLTLDLIWLHPFEGQVMDMAKPVSFGVIARGEKEDLFPTLKPISVKGHPAWQGKYRVKRPGDHVFHVTPAPYFEPAEDKLIIHYTKVVVPAFGMEEGWDALAGTPIEIEPLTRPYGLYAGNLFTGRVLLNGKPAPGVDVEVEYYNKDGRFKAPADPFVTQVVRTDGNGVFSYAMPLAGWWGFAALADGPEELTGPDGKPHAVEIGGLIWVNVQDFKRGR